MVLVCVNECSWCILTFSIIDVPGTHEQSFHTGIEALMLTFCALCLVFKDCLSSFHLHAGEGERLWVVPAVFG